MSKPTEIGFNQIAYSYDASGVLKRFDIAKSIFFNFNEGKRNHQTIIDFLRDGRLYEPDVSGFLTRIVKEGDCVIDVGANIGFHTMLMASLVGPNGFVDAFEPAPENVAEIILNQTSNGFENIKVHQDVLGREANLLLNFVFMPFDSGTSFVAKGSPPAGGDCRPMLSKTLDEELKAHQIIKLVKMDVEGSEFDVLRGAENILRAKKVKYWIVEYCPPELHRMGGDIESLRSFMAGFGLDMFVLDYFGGLPKHIPQNVFTYGKYLQNLLFADFNELGADWVADDVTSLVTGRAN